MDGAILVVAGTDGTMPQTKEHLLLANLVYITHSRYHVHRFVNAVLHLPIMEESTFVIDCLLFRVNMKFCRNLL